jgi:hypothetical protein
MSSMFSKLRSVRRPSPAMVVAFIALLVAGGGAAVAAIPDSDDGEIHGCYSTRPGSTGNLRVIDAQAGETCAKGETALVWNQQGPQGPPGPTAAGTASTPGTPAASPDGDLTLAVDVNAPVSGRILAIWNQDEMAGHCSNTDEGSSSPDPPDVGIYLDGAPVPGTRRTLAADDELTPVNSSGITANPVSPGTHTLEYAADCPDGDLVFISHGGTGGFRTALTGILLGG